MMTANSPNSDVDPIAREDELDAYDKIISYVITVEATAQRLLNVSILKTGGR